MANTLTYIINSQIELNLSYMPYIKGGGIFVPTTEEFQLGAIIKLNLQLPGETKPKEIEAEVVWITPKNALYQVYQGVGVQFRGEGVKSLLEEIKASLDDTMDVGGYTYGLALEPKEKVTKKIPKTSK